MADTKDLLAMGAMILALFIVGILVGVSIIGFSELKKTACEQNVADAYVWEDGICKNETGPLGVNGSSAITVTAVTKIAVVETVVDVILGLLALVVIMGVFLIIVKAARKMKSGFGGQ